MSVKGAGGFVACISAVRAGVAFQTTHWKAWSDLFGKVHRHEQPFYWG